MLLLGHGQSLVRQSRIEGAWRGGSPATQLVNATLASFACPIYRVVLRVSDGSINGRAPCKVRFLWHGCHICRDHCGLPEKPCEIFFLLHRQDIHRFGDYFLFLIFYKVYSFGKSSCGVKAEDFLEHWLYFLSLISIS